jgi:hypothetical protein
MCGRRASRAFNSPPSSQKLTVFSRGDAAHRRLQGEAALADAFMNRAQAAERQAAALEDEAFALRARAARLEGEIRRHAAWRHVLAA